MINVQVSRNPVIPNVDVGKDASENTGSTVLNEFRIMSPCRDMFVFCHQLLLFQYKIVNSFAIAQTLSLARFFPCLL